MHISPSKLLMLTIFGLCFALIAYTVYRIWRSPSVVIEWSTASELDTVGFNLYRSENEDGLYEPINPHLIPASVDPYTGDDYRYLDEDVVAGVTYYYLLEDVDVRGNKNRNGPIEVKAGSFSPLEVILLIASFTILAGLSGYFWSSGKSSHRIQPEQERIHIPLER